MAVSQADIDALTSAIANGERSVRFADGRSVEYHTPADLIRARDYLVAIKARETASGNIHSRATKLYHAGRGFQ